MIGIVAGIIGILVGLNALTGFNPLKDIIDPKPSPSVAPPKPSREGPPLLSVASQDWNGPCREGSCAVTAIIRNRGGAGGGVARFRIISTDGKDTELASCSAIVPAILRNGSASVGCTAYSAQLSRYFSDSSSATVRMRVTVD